MLRPAPLRTTRSAFDVRAGRRDWFRIRNATSDEAEIWIYEEIGFFGITAASFVEELEAVTADAITLHINSPGGDVFDGVAIYRALKEHRATVTVRVDAIAGSIASVIAMAGDTIFMAKRSLMMVHEPFGFAIGDADDMRKTADILDKLGDQIAGIYADRAGGTEAEWRAVMSEETWYSDQEAVDAGLADEVVEETAVENRFDLSVFRHPPSNGAGPPAEPVKTEASPPADWRRSARLKVAAAALEVSR